MADLRLETGHQPQNIPTTNPASQPFLQDPVQTVPPLGSLCELPQQNPIPSEDPPPPHIPHNRSVTSSTFAALTGFQVSVPLDQLSQP